jgi:ferrous iron transport protein B
MLAPFMPCGAKIPIIALFAGTFFNNAGWVSVVAYFSGIFIIFIGALLINKMTGAKRKSYFIIELPDYKLPDLWGAVKSMLSRGWEYIVKAATIILVCNMAVQIMQSFDWSFKEALAPDSSILASVASVFAFVILPIVGVLSWQLAAATITGFIAKENVVGTLAVCFAGANLMEASGLSTFGALAFLMFNLFSPPCFAAIGAMNSELKSKKWFFGAVAFQLLVGYSVSYFVYTIGTLIVSPETLAVTPALIGLAAVLTFALVIFLIIKNTEKKLKKA